jgi:hypothetical protein
MPLPDFSNQGELPTGAHQATMDEIIARFGSGTPQRQAARARLVRIYKLIKATGKLERLIIFGSYITTKPNPNDVDLVLIIAADFNLQACDEETRGLFEHTRAAEEFGASIIWIRPSMLLLETREQFIEYWQIKRDRTRRGIVEVRA